jgi:hypothetical protein
MALIDIQRDAIGCDEFKEAFAQTQGVLMRVPKYSLPIWEVQMVCNHPQQIMDLQRQVTDLQAKQIIDLQRQVTELQAKQFLPTEFDHIELDQQIHTMTDERAEASRRPAAPGKDKKL